MKDAKKDVIMINVTGVDKPGLTASLTHILAEHNATILDIGQAVIHDHLSLGILVSIPHEGDTAPILKDLLFRSYELGINIKFKPISGENYGQWVNQQGKERYIITLIARQLSALHIARVSEIISEQGLNIDYITRLSGRSKLNGEEQSGSKQARAVVEFSVRGTPKNSNDMKACFMNISQEVGVDIAFQVDNIFRRNRRLVCFDMDSTLIQAEVIDELAKEAGVGAEVSAITEAAMRGELDFKESFIKRISLLKGLNAKVMQDVAERLPLTEGTERLISTLKRYGYKIAILSGGFNFFGQHLKNKLGIDYVFANELDVKDGLLTGTHKGDIVDGARKAELLKYLAFKEEIHLEQVIAVGDGSNDLPMLSVAGLGIAFHAKPKVKKEAKHAISNIGLDAILYMLGFRDREIEA